jgi:hypothetical protein
MRSPQCLHPTVAAARALFAQPPDPALVIELGSSNWGQTRFLFTVSRVRRAFKRV